MKKRYINPEMKIVKIQTMQMLASSPVPEVTTTEYDPTEEGEYIGSRQGRGFWDDEEY